ncbi:tuliposide A-converting enzyme 1, chloroplastic isoform X2 [Setaria italica]|uniref:tuliposide A-converting enzyme 1, chloroplastic isoform X2 n=1 Tax=Setaria italica TaxID=4555 RepID=UPI000350E8E6|nr:tuliposide A-converting enzyme 1, chloroplastic isoform X2 [Setaria italica]XP_034602618.1 tuliposide A-converting enzyme 1, chloroplastic-like isoform X2 [Setaria viridis]
MAGSGASDNEVVFKAAHRIRIFKSGRVERYCGSDPTPASTDAGTGVASKDHAISPDVAVRLYLPPEAAKDDGSSRLPVLVYFHGGGFCLLSAFNAIIHGYLTSLAARARAVVVSVEYRLAPEHPIPAAYEDSWRALGWVASHASGGAGEEPWLADHADFSRLCLAGESAGANIAHHMAMRARAEGLPGSARISGVVLVHPYFLSDARVASEESNPAMAANMVRMWRVVAPATTGLDDPWINPLADGAPALRALACGRVLVCLAEQDVLRDRGRAYCEGLAASGWAGELEVVQAAGQDHCFHLSDFTSGDAVWQDEAIARQSTGVVYA